MDYLSPIDMIRERLDGGPVTAEAIIAMLNDSSFVQDIEKWAARVNNRIEGAAKANFTDASLASKRELQIKTLPFGVTSYT